ncbi:MAG: hypothetical protein JNN01_24970 [Opitutaceae bacterium]|nr:hypothetical protein [Opitutaceae bacterium]
MHRVHLPLSLALLVVAAALVAAIWMQRNEQSQKQLTLDRETRRIAALRARAEATANRPKSGLGPGSLPPGASAPAVNPTLRAAIVARDEVRKEVARRAERRQVLNRYLAGMNALALPPATLSALKHLLVSHAATPVAAPGVSLAEYRRAYQAAETALRHQVGGLIGPDAAEVLMASAIEDSLDWTLGTDLWDAGVPLEPHQTEVLAQAALRSGYSPAVSTIEVSGESTPDPVTGITTSDTRFLLALRPYFTPAQLEAITRSLREEHAYIRAMRAYREKRRLSAEGSK